MRTLTVRATIRDLEITGCGVIPAQLGEFCVDTSPNAELYFFMQGLFDEPPKGQPDKDFPIQHYFLETQIQTDAEGRDRLVKADSKVARFETLLRLFQAGALYVRTFAVFEPTGERATELILAYRPTLESVRKREPPGEFFWEFEPYALDSEGARKLELFYDKYWAMCWGELTVAIGRFSSAHERLSWRDRLIDLMVAMEAMFGDGQWHSYKIPLRCSCLLESPGAERQEIFKSVRAMYGRRSRILHGGKAKVSKTQVLRFEDVCRRCILRMLDLINSHTLPDTKGTTLDNYLFFS